MSEKTAELYKAVDEAISGFRMRVLKHARDTINQENSTLGTRIDKLERSLSAARTVVPAPDGPKAARPTSPTGRPAMPSAPSKFPPLPIPLSVRSLAKYVESLGFEVTNNREMDGGLWVFKDKADFGHVAQRLEVSGVRCRYYPDGRRRSPGPQYELDPLKRLPL
jgi:hypothetical protein